MNGRVAIFAALVSALLGTTVLRNQQSWVIWVSALVIVVISHFMFKRRRKPQAGENIRLGSRQWAQEMYNAGLLSEEELAKYDLRDMK